METLFDDISIPVEKSFIDWIFFLRPVLHPPVWTIVLLGYARCQVKPESSWLIVYLLLISSAQASWAYIVNQIADIDSDRENNKLFFLPRGLISKRMAVLSAAFMAVAAVAGSFCLKTELGIIGIGGIILGYLYSGRPFYGKNHPIAGPILNGLGHGSLTFAHGFVGAGGLIADALFQSVPYVFAVIAVFLGTTLPDIRGDTVSGKKTPAVALGADITIILMTLSLMIALILSLLLWDIPLLIVCNICMPFYIYSIIKRDIKSGVIAARVSVLLLSMGASVLFPWYFALLLFLFVTSRIYYRRRFDLAYPDFS